ncbi:hypothetical protein JW968_03900 [Candidatus Woesearchaeota archaeon]|nr:hypothetical protein [Candidatus Woesearchaeota archaeon]
MAKVTYCITIILLALSAILLSGCDSDGAQGPEVLFSELPEQEINVDKLEIFHFHGTNQCYSCITVGNYAEETVNTYFADELKSGRIVFGHVNAELPENSELVKKYGATGSSLWLGVYSGDGFKAEQNTQVWYKIRDKQDYMDYLKVVIEQKLAGK